MAQINGKTVEYVRTHNGLVSTMIESGDGIIGGVRVVAVYGLGINMAGAGYSVPLENFMQVVAKNTLNETICYARSLKEMRGVLALKLRKGEI